MSEKPRYNLEESRERELEEGLLWGEFIPTNDNYSKDYSCINNECSEYGNPDIDLDKHTVGVRKAPFRGGSEYAQMVECPDCKIVHWHHIPLDEKDIKDFSNQIKAKKLK